MVKVKGRYSERTSKTSSGTYNYPRINLPRNMDDDLKKALKESGDIMVSLEMPDFQLHPNASKPKRSKWPEL